MYTPCSLLQFLQAPASRAFGDAPNRPPLLPISLRHFAWQYYISKVALKIEPGTLAENSRNIEFAIKTDEKKTEFNLDWIWPACDLLTGINVNSVTLKALHEKIDANHIFAW